MSLSKEEDTLARTLWGEARSEGYSGMLAVAATIMNRVNTDLNNDKKPDWWGEGVVEVCTKPWQYSCWNANDPNLPKLKAVTTADVSFKKAVEIAIEAIKKGRIIPDPTFGATHYVVDTYVDKTAWTKGRKPLVKIGRHVFYANPL